MSGVSGVRRFRRGEAAGKLLEKIMSKIDYDKVHQVGEQLRGQVHDLVDSEVTKADLTEKEEELLRDKLTDEFRFWKRN